MLILAGVGVVGVTEAQRVHDQHRPGAHGEDVADDPADAEALHDFRVALRAVVFLVVRFAPALFAVDFFVVRLAATDRFAAFLAVVDFAATCAS